MAYRSNHPPAYAVVMSEWLREASVLFVVFGIIDPLVNRGLGKEIDGVTIAVIVLLVLFGTVFGCFAVGCEHYLQQVTKGP